MSTVEGGAKPGQDLFAVRGVAYRRCSEGQQFLDTLVLRHLQCLGDERVELA